LGRSLAEEEPLSFPRAQGLGVVEGCSLRNTCDGTLWPRQQAGCSTFPCYDDQRAILDGIHRDQ
jgi:hypothetical protein